MEKMGYFLLIFSVFFFLFSSIDLYNPSKLHIFLSTIFFSLFLIYLNIKKITLRHNLTQKDLYLRLIYKDVILDLCGATLGFYMTYYLSQGMNITLSAGLTGMIFSLISNSYKKVYDLQFSAFCGVFAGMTSHIFLHSSKIIQILPFFVGVLFFISRNIFLGIGGKLGALAYVAIIIFMVLNGIFI